MILTTACGTNKTVTATATATATTTAVASYYDNYYKTTYFHYGHHYYDYHYCRSQTGPHRDVTGGCSGFFMGIYRSYLL
jgi:hypothetical protein